MSLRSIMAKKILQNGIKNLKISTETSIILDKKKYWLHIELTRKPNLPRQQICNQVDIIQLKGCSQYMDNCKLNQQYRRQAVSTHQLRDHNYKLGNFQNNQEILCIETGSIHNQHELYLAIPIGCSNQFLYCTVFLIQNQKKYRLHIKGRP